MTAAARGATASNRARVLFHRLRMPTPTLLATERMLTLRDGRLIGVRCGYPLAHAVHDRGRPALRPPLPRDARKPRDRETIRSTRFRCGSGKTSSGPRNRRNRRLRAPRASPRVHVRGSRRPARQAPRPNRRGGERHRDCVAAPRPRARSGPAEAPGRLPAVHRFEDRDVQGVRAVGPRGRKGRARPLRSRSRTRSGRTP